MEEMHARLKPEPMWRLLCCHGYHTTRKEITNWRDREKKKGIVREASVRGLAMLLIPFCKRREATEHALRRAAELDAVEVQAVPKL